jgi:hypothetical protein
MNFTFIGCSFTVGEGLPQEKSDVNNYTNIIGEKFNARIKNLAEAGNSNYNIFMTGINEILFDCPDVLFLQWSGLQRHWLYPNLDIIFPITPNAIAPVKDINYLDTQFSKKSLEKFVDQFLLLNHDYQNILMLINYCKILETLAKDKCRIVMINGLVPWTKECMDPSAVTNPYENFSTYTKNLLSTDKLPDSDVAIFFNKICNGLAELDKSTWVNMFNSMGKQILDLGNDNSHPGPKSHQLYANIIIKHLESNNGN